ncbi:MAG: ribonuclease R [Coxiellaceae bacterium]|jgi:ribonuclease R|nr:ribonuclease R [Coxiellaceae bacterium]
MKKISKVDPFYSREARKYKDPIPSREFILQYFEKSRMPKRYSELIRYLDLEGKKSYKALRCRLNAMVRDGQLLVDCKGRYVLVKQLDMLSGYVICHKDGYGFFVPDKGSGDVFLNPKHMRGLFPGDRVLVSVTYINRQGKREGTVVKILERSLTRIVGRYFIGRGVGYITPTNKNITQDVIIPPGRDGSAKVGQFVVAKITNFPTLRNNAATGQIIKILGRSIEFGLEIEMAINIHDLPYIWPQEVLYESEVLHEVKQEQKNQRRQLQYLPFVTIDGEDAKDFDDAIYCRRHEKDGWILYVAIADVSQYVGYDTSLDKEALKRGNSVYFPQYVIPMLPEVLSNNLCSLKPHLERLVVVCEMHITNSGKIASYEFYEGIIKSHARFTYDKVFALLEGKTKEISPLLPELQELWRLYSSLLKQRKIRGALDFSRIETQIIFNDKHKIKHIKPIEHHYVHGIIEECMLAANVCASGFLLKKKIPALYRVHGGPDDEKLYNLLLFLKSLGLELKGGNKPKSIHYAELLKKIVGRRDEHLIETVLLRSLKQAVYTAENIGHFGLAYEAYVHFTSPIRRYPDLINHRAIKYLLRGGRVSNYYYTKSVIQNFGNHCSLTERRADDAERDVVMWYKCEFMKDKVGKTFSGIISGVTNFGIFIELKDIFVEGLVHITSLKNDYYKFEPLHHRLIGKRSGKVYRLGDPIKVIVAKVNLDEKEINFDLV